MNITEALEKLGEKVEEFKNTKDLNVARIVGEGLCKVLILNTGIDELIEKSEGKTLQPLTDLLKADLLKIPESHVKKIKSSLNTVQTFGNIESHFDQKQPATPEEIQRVETAIEALLGYIFNSKETIYIDQKLPENLYSAIHKLRVSDEDWQCEKIISLVYPNRTKTLENSSKEHNFYTIKDADKRKLGLFFLGRNVSFKNTLEKSLKDFDIGSLSSLTFLFPNETSITTGQPVKGRKEYITTLSIALIEGHSKNSKSLETRHEFIEDYIWDMCLSDEAKGITTNRSEPYFIDQKLHTANSEILSLNFVEDIISNKIPDKKPLYLVIGDGGAGKTTFCKQAVRKINELQHKNNKKAAILISSYDIPSDIGSSDIQVDSLQSLYNLISKTAHNQISIDSFSLNISSGNLLVIIDGLDEIQSKLKEKFSLERFVNSVRELNDTYLNCSVIIASREINRTNIKMDDISVLKLKGFDDTLIEQYLNKRFLKQPDAITRAKKIISEIKGNEELTPLILRFISELAAEPNLIKINDGASRYLRQEKPLDNVIFQLINRETKKQNLPASCDQYFEILKDIVFEYGGQISPENLNYLTEITLADSDNLNSTLYFENIDNSSFLSKTNEAPESALKLKHDSLIQWIKSRYLAYLINNNSQENDKQVLKILAQDCYKGGSLVTEICKFKNNATDYERSVISAISQQPNGPDKEQSQRAISALTYVYFQNKAGDRSENIDLLSQLFNQSNSREFKKVSIYGDFYPLDLSTAIISDGYFNDYSNLAKSNITEETRFKNSKFENFNRNDFGRSKLSSENFIQCTLCSELRHVVEASQNNAEKNREQIKNDIEKILKVGFWSNSFLWKSEKLYLQQCASLNSKLTLKKFLETLVNERILVKERATASSDHGYIVAEEHQNEVEDFLTQDIVGNTIQNLIQGLA